MKIYFKNSLLIIVVFFLNACILTNRKSLYTKTEKNDNIEFIKYEGDDHYGDYITSVMSTKEHTYFYNIKIMGNNPPHLSRMNYNVYKKDGNDLDTYRSLEFLVSDTSIKNEPNFFGESINGYYADTFIVNNVISNKHTNIMISPITKDELKLFTLIDSLTKLRNIKYPGFDTTKVIGWFKYIF